MILWSDKVKLFFCNFGVISEAFKREAHCCILKKALLSQCTFVFEDNLTPRSSKFVLETPH